jgi:type IV secretion system protein VirB10
MSFRVTAAFFSLAFAAVAQTSGEVAKNSGEYVVEQGTRIPLSLMNSVTTKHAAEGDRIYLETVFPILVDGKIVIPPGSYVSGTVTQVKRPGRVKGRGEIYLRFDSLILPNGVTRDFRARVGQLDGRATEELDKTEGKIKSEGNKGGDARTVGEAAGGGASIGAIAGSVAGHTGMGVGIGAAAGAAAGLAGVLLSRGPDAVLAKGTTMEMVLDRPIRFADTELDTSGAANRRPIGDGSGPLPSKKSQNVPGVRRYPL